MGRKLLWASFALVPITLVLEYLVHPDKVVLFAVSALALLPLAWLIGEATEHAAEHTGPGIGGFLNASFGNAPELIIAVFAVNKGLPNVVRGSIAGSIVSNVLLVLGFALLLTKEERLDRRSLLSQIGLVGFAVALFLIPSIPGWHGDPDRHELAVATIPVAAVLLGVYAGYTFYGLRRHKALHATSDAAPHPEGWSLRTSLVALTIATVLTAIVSEILVHSLDAFARSVGLSQFFVSIVIVAIVGNAAEHGGAVVIARRGKIRLASEIAVTSGAQVGLLVAPLVALISWIVKPALPLAFRPVEIATMAFAALFVAGIVSDAKGKRWEGAAMIAAYAGLVVVYGLSGDR
jgi:Ca2+:H+ antiporter